jgi:hypothetical protein
MKARRLALLGVVAAVALGAAAPAQAINDPRVPGDDCASDNAAAVGDPLAPGNPGINFHTPQPGTPSNAFVSPFVSGNNPGVSTGAKAVTVSNAFGTCRNDLP